MAKTALSMLEKIRTKSCFPQEAEKKDYSLIIRSAAAFFAGFFFSQFSLIDEISPFSVAFVCSVPFDYCASSFAGTVLGCILRFEWQRALRYSMSLLLCAFVRLLISKRFLLPEKPLFMALLAFLSTAFGGIIYSLFTLLSPFTLLTALSEGIIGFCACLIFIKALRAPFFSSSAQTNKTRDTVYTVTALCVFILCMSGLTVKGISPGRILACVTVIFFALFKGSAYGSMTGICLGFILSLDSSFGHIFPMLALGGLVCGAFACYGQLACSLCFSGTAAVVCLAGGIDRELIVTLAEVLISTAVFMLIPASRVAELQSFIRRKGLLKDEKADRMVADSLKKAANNIRQVSEIINNVGDKLEKEAAEESPDDIISHMKLKEMRRVLTDQFSSMGDFLNEFASQVCCNRIVDAPKSTAIRRALTEAGIETDALYCFMNKEGAVSVEIVLIDRPFNIDWKKAKNVIELITKRRFEIPDVAVSDLRTTLTFYQKLPYRLQIGFCQKSAKDNTPCGDSVSAAAHLDSTGFALISDGMGTGARAAIDSTMTATIMKKLICSGFSFDSAMKIVNSALITRFQEESIATVDGIEANLFTGEVFFYKAGASYSIVRKGNRAVTLEKASLPLGILRNVSFAKSKFTAEPGDIILLLSDGVTQGDWGWISDELLCWSTSNMEDLSMHILKLAAMRTEKATADDMTVVAVKLERNR